MKDTIKRIQIDRNVLREDILLDLRCAGGCHRQEERSNNWGISKGGQAKPRRPFKPKI